MKPPQYRFESTDSKESDRSKTGTEVPLIAAAPICSNFSFGKDQNGKEQNGKEQNFKYNKARRSLIPHSDDYFMPEFEATPIIEFSGTYYPKEVDQAIENAMFIAQHIGNMNIDWIWFDLIWFDSIWFALIKYYFLFIFLSSPLDNADEYASVSLSIKYLKYKISIWMWFE